MHRPIRRRIVPAAALLALAACAPAALSANGDLSLLSVDGSGALGNQPVEASAISADGRFVAFTSAADLTATPVGGVTQLYVRDRQTGTTVLASSNAAGQPANAAVDTEDVFNVLFSISGNGRYAVFASQATNLTPADTDNAKDVYRKDLTTGAVDLVSVTGSGTKADAAVFGDPDVSYDGSRVSFGSGAATNLFPSDGNASSDIVVRDLRAGTTVLASQSSAGEQAAGTSERSAISQDGNVVVFTAVAGSDNLVPGDAGADNDTIVRNLRAGTTAAASDPGLNGGSSNFPDVSGDGRFVVHEASDQYDAVNDTNAFNDIYMTDMQTGVRTLVSAKDGLTAASAVQSSLRPSVSADGRRVAYHSAASDLTANDADGTVDVFLRTLPTSTTLISVRADGTTKSNTDSSRAALAGDGGLVAFVHDDNGEATKLLATDTNTKPDVFAKELLITDADSPVLTVSGPADGGTVTQAQADVTGTAADPSGIGALTVNGTAVTPGAGGAFSVPVALSPGANQITVAATDGAGKQTTRTITVTRTTAAPAPGAGVPPATRRPRVTGIGVSIARAKVTTRFTLTAPARVRAVVQRRVVLRVGKRPVRTRIVFRTATGPVVKTLAAGRNSIALPTAKRLASGRYRLRLVLTNTAGRTVVTKSFRVRPPARPASGR